MNPSPPDLQSCASEPIRVPGAIQPHGRMIVLAAADRRLLAWSANWPARDAAQAAIGALPALPPLVAGDSPVPVGSVTLDGRAFDAAAHSTGEHLILEFEASAPPAGGRAAIYTLARQVLPRLQQARSMLQLTGLAAAEMKALTGFGRCLVYRFDEAGHGEVLSEVLDEGYDSYEGHRFPAADVPAQARELYLLNQFRIIPDAGYTPAALLGAEPGFDARALDLSQANLRSVSPIHLEYMRNMGTLASMSVSIVVRGRLWGLVSCHNHEPRFLPFDTRVACEHLGRLLSMQIEAKEENAEVESRAELHQLTLQIISGLSDSDATLQQLVRDPQPLLRLARAGGAAVVLDGQCWTVGDTPAREQIDALADWLVRQGGSSFHTDRLPELFPDAAGMQAQASGVLALSISQVHRHLILWFRPEIVQTIQWAGDPRKEARSGDGRLHPRRSFASWKEQVRGRSAPWLASEVAAALELRQAVMGIVLRRAQEMAEVATELGRVNKELEAFSYTVSHDLRAPMRHIAGYVDLVLGSEGATLGERSRRYLSHVKEASAFAGHLVDALLDFSRMGRSALKRSQVNTQVLVADLVREVSQLEPARRIEWDVQSPLPGLWADPLLLQLALRNLLGNAVKYTRGRDPARITVRGVSNGAGAGLEVSDNGVGFQMQYVGKLFGVFQRLHQADEFEGTGIGLASVRRIVERHGGSVWAKGELNQGASFGFTLPHNTGAAKAGPEWKDF
jgi:light-regulated signal transduction histidine kinase (bacteriophytochrome)